MKPIILPEQFSKDGAKFIKSFRFVGGHSVPVFEVDNLAAFNQLIGYSKFVNRDYGTVYYRGTDGLYDTVRPSIMRQRKHGQALDITELIHKIEADKYLNPSLQLEATIKPRKDNYIADHNLNKRIRRCNKYRIEGLLQHYAGFTRFVDIVDNHWIALWMGLHRFDSCGEGRKFIKCSKRELTPFDVLNMVKDPSTAHQFSEELYVYILLLAFPDRNVESYNGVVETDEMVLVDLRKALPSFYLRPHAQHALVMRRRDNGEKSTDAAYYDLAEEVVGILRVRIDIAARWLGDGQLVSQENMFPSPSVDNGYNGLLKNQLFEYPFEIKKYF